MREQIREALENWQNAMTDRSFADAEQHLQENFMAWLRWQDERIEQLEDALKDIIECSDIESAVKEIATSVLNNP